MAIDAALDPYDPAYVHLHELTREKVDALEQRLASLTQEERAALRKEYRSLNDRKTKLYEDYRQAKKQMQEYGVVKKNVDSILYPSQSRAREQER